MPRPYRVVGFGYCNYREAARRGQDPSLRIAGRQAIMGEKMQIPGRFVGDA